MGSTTLDVMSQSIDSVAYRVNYTFLQATHAPVTAVSEEYNVTSDAVSSCFAQVEREVERCTHSRHTDTDTCVRVLVHHVALVARDPSAT